MPVSPGGGFGAWELALRYSETDLDFLAGSEGLATPAGGVRGGQQRIWTVGVNWYLNPNVRLTFNYLNIDVDRLNPSLTAFGATPTRFACSTPSDRLLAAAQGTLAGTCPDAKAAARPYNRWL